MIYMFEVNMLIALAVFGLAGVLILALFVWTEAQEYALARRAMRHIAAAPPREPFVISRTSSRNHDEDSLRTA